MTRKTILITGAEGLIGSYLRATLADTYDLRLITRASLTGVPSFVTDIADLPAMRAACQGVDSIIHLAGSSSGNASWDEVLHNNIIGTYTLFEAARQANVPQVIFASSNHAVGGHEWDHPDIYRLGLTLFNHLTLPRADSLYGVSKCFGEILGRLYADTHDMRVICLRIGSVTADDIPDVHEAWADRLTALWQSKRDLSQMIEKCLAADTIRFDIFYGVSNNRYNYYDWSHAQEMLGYIPQDSAEDHIPQQA